MCKNVITALNYTCSCLLLQANVCINYLSVPKKKKKTTVMGVNEVVRQFKKKINILLIYCDYNVVVFKTFLYFKFIISIKLIIKF